MFDMAIEAAELAATLARAVGKRGTVCLGCPLATGGSSGITSGPLTLSRSPLRGPFIELERLLLVVASGDCALDLERLAAAGVPEVWLLDVEEGLLTSLSRPLRRRYRRRSLILPTERVKLAGLPEVEVVPLQGR